MATLEYGDWYAGATIRGMGLTGYVVTFTQCGKHKYKSYRVGLTLARLYARSWVNALELPEGRYTSC